MNMPTHRPLDRKRGIALLEVLVAMLIVAFGILGYVGVQARSTLANLEGYQRSQALILASEMAERIKLNYANATAYVGNDIGTAAGSGQNCDSLTVIAERDVCEWAANLQGATETLSGAKVGALLNARGCITSVPNITDPTRSHYQVTVAWQGYRNSEGATAICGKGSAPFTDESLRRAVSVVVQIANLNPATP